MAYNVQVVGQHGEPGPDRVFQEQELEAGLSWIENHLQKGFKRAHIWQFGGKRLATLTERPKERQVVTWRDLVLHDAVQTRQAVIAPPTPAPRPSSSGVVACTKPREAGLVERPAKAAATPTLADMITAEVAELKKGH